MILLGKRPFLTMPVRPSLPYDAEVEYLQSSGTQYIDTGIYCLQKYSFELDVSVEYDSVNYETWFGGSTSDSYRGFCFRKNASYQQALFNIGGTMLSNSLSKSVRHSISMSGTGTVVIDGTSNSLSPSQDAFDSSVRLYLFSYSINNTPFRSGNAKFYGFKCYDGSTLVLDFQPVRFTNELGQSEGAMYDRISKQLFRNQGTGNFIVGRDTNPISARSYVNDGLIAMWDGIENAGWGVHDESANAWVDLTGNHVLSYQFTPSFTNDSFVLPGTDKVAYCDSELWRDAVKSNNCTVEMCFKGYSVGDNNSIISLNAGITSGSERAWWQWGTIAFGYRISSGYTWLEPSILSKGENDALTLSFPVADCYKNGSLVKSGTAGTSNISSKVLMIGRIGSYKSTINGYISMRADIHSLRIYNKVLSAAEIATNYAIDAQRFGISQS